jgi:hypothetical protein
MEKYLLSENKNVFAGIYDDKSSAEKAYFSLRSCGYAPGQINVLMSKDTQLRYYSDFFNKHLSHPIEKNITGGIADNFSSFGTNLKIPWPGLVVSGPVESDFDITDSQGSSTIMEAVLKSGIPKDEVVRYIEGLKNGKIIITTIANEAATHLASKGKNKILEGSAV